MSDVKINGLAPQVEKPVVTIPSSQQTQGIPNVNEKVVPENVGQLKEARQNAEAQEVKQASVESAVTKLNEYVQSIQRDLQFNLDDQSGKTVITVLDRQTSAVIRQIPDDVALKLAQDLQQNEPLSLFNAKV